ncbi:hypothetical protein WG68_10360 [Arsukibacterium ikkense]|uniref:Lipoprotein n=1 Tax=Arsukibacterium ikkense TaxID=336831 RepID=A0A0M2V4W1_9GAMM|nr:hypothetical protein [Arsukibacterium ikkense]KKO45444.1 hypothetical protein WG68_10360 [Arsukibacterium ikkense]
MRLRSLLISLLLLNACHSVAQLPEQDWPEFNCSTGSVIMNFVDLSVCVESEVYSKVQVLAGSMPTIVFEQDVARFDALFYEADASSLQILSRHLKQQTAAQTLNVLFRLPAKEQKSELELQLLQVFDMRKETKLSVYLTPGYQAYIRVNPDEADNTIYIADTKSDTLYRLVGNFTEAEARHWLSRLRPAVTH